MKVPADVYTRRSSALWFTAVPARTAVSNKLVGPVNKTFTASRSISGVSLLTANARPDESVCLPSCLSQLFDSVSECPCVRADSLIARDDRDELRRFIEQLRRRQVDRVKCANRFDGKRPTNAVKHGSIEVEKEAAPFEGSKCAYRSLLILRRQPASRSRADDCSSGL